LAVAALLHKYVPAVIDYPDDQQATVSAALDACRSADVAVYLEPADLVGVERPDEKAVITQVAELYKCLSNPDWVRDLYLQLFATRAINERIQKLIAESKGDVRAALVALQDGVAPLLERKQKYCGLCQQLFDALCKLWDLLKSGGAVAVELSAALSQIERLKAELSSERSGFDRITAELNSQRAEAERLNAELGGRRAENESLNEELRSARSEIECRKQEVQCAKTESSCLADLVEAKRAEIERLTAELAASRADADERRSELAAERSETERLKWRGRAWVGREA
jgi:DNA repair exonuclease SbcCD ATPase subunit